MPTPSARDRFLDLLRAAVRDGTLTKLTLGKLLTFDGASESFTGEGAAEANAMLTREYRAPYVVPAAGKV